MIKSFKIDENFQRLLMSYQFLMSYKFLISLISFLCLISFSIKTLDSKRFMKNLPRSSLSVIVKHFTYLVWNFNILRISKCFICPVQKTVVEMFYSIFSSENLLFINYLSQYGQITKISIQDFGNIRKDVQALQKQDRA